MALPFSKKTTWATGQSVTPGDLNRLEQGIADVESAARLHIPTIEVFGHSIAAGGGANNANDSGYWQRVGEFFNARRIGKFAKGGAVLGWQNSGSGATGDGGIPYVLQAINPGPQIAGARPATVQAAIIHYGLNDLAAYGTAKVGIFKDALRAAISRVRAGSVYEDSDASIAYDANWSAVANNYAGSGVGIRPSSGAAASTLTITVPADYEGNPIALGYMGQFSSNPVGSKITVNVDGALHGTKLIDDTTRDTNKVFSPFNLYRITGLAAGAHTITLTVDAGAVIYFDYWQIEAPNPPLIVLPLLHAPFNLDYWGTAPGATWANAPVRQPGIDAFNTAIQQVATEFGQNIITVPLDGLGLDQATNNYPDGVHPNERGHAIITKAITDAIIANAPYPNLYQARSADRVAWVEPTALTGAWLNYGAGLPRVGYTKSQDGIVSVKGAAKSGAINTTIFTLPPGYLPFGERAAATSNLDFPGICFNGTTWAFCMMRVNNVGAVAPVGQAAGYNSAVEFNFTFPAGGY